MNFLKQNLQGVDNKQELEDMLGFYIEKIAKREKEIQSRYGESLQVSKEIDIVENERAKLEEELFEHDHEFHAKRSEMKQILAKITAIEQLMEERRGQLEFSIMKMGDENFEQYLGGNKEVFNVVKKTYGAKISEKMKREQRDEFKSMVKSAYKNRREDME